MAKWLFSPSTLTRADLIWIGVCLSLYSYIGFWNVPVSIVGVIVLTTIEKRVKE